MLKYSGRKACFKHSNLLKVNDPELSAHPVKGTRQLVMLEGRAPQPVHTIEADRAGSAPKSNYELFNCNNFNIRYWSWNYRGCWHQTCPPMDLVKGFKLYSFQLQDRKGPVLLFIVTTSLYQDWVICAPAAFLRSGSRFSGSLSGIEP